MVWCLVTPLINKRLLAVASVTDRTCSRTRHCATGKGETIRYVIVPIAWVVTSRQVTQHITRWSGELYVRQLLGLNVQCIPSHDPSYCDIVNSGEWHWENLISHQSWLSAPLRTQDDSDSAGQVARLDADPRHGHHLRRLLCRDHCRDPGVGSHQGAGGETDAWWWWWLWNLILTKLL